MDHDDLHRFDLGFDSRAIPLGKPVRRIGVDRHDRRPLLLARGPLRRLRLFRTDRNEQHRPVEGRSRGLRVDLVNQVDLAGLRRELAVGEEDLLGKRVEHRAPFERLERGTAIGDPPQDAALPLPSVVGEFLTEADP